MMVLPALISSGLFAQNETGIKDENSKTTVAATKRVLVEEATGTWCGFCVRGICFMDDLNTLHPTTTGLIAVHNGDPMTDATYDAGIGPKIGGYPSGLVDRQATEVDPQDFASAYASRITYAPPVDVFIDNVSWNSTTRALSFKVNAKTVVALSGSYRFNAVITEMQVHGTTSTYDQHNYYTNNAYGAMCGFESKPATIPAAQMYYDFVGRTILGGWAGTASSIPATVANNTTVSYTYTKTIPATWNENKLTLIGFVINSTSGVVENCSKTNMLTTSVGETFKTEFVAYPNPSQGIVSFRNNTEPMNITVYNAMGQTVKSEKNVNQQIDLSSLEDGIYFVNFANTKESITQRFVLMK